jgi:thiaminase
MITAEHEMDNLKAELAKLAQEVFDQSGLTKTEFCEKLGISSSNWKRDIESGTWLSDIDNLLTFHKNVSAEASEAVAAFIFNHFRIKVASIANTNNASNDNDEVARLTKQNDLLEQELAQYRKLLNDLGVSLKKNLDHLTDFSFKKTFG